MRNLRNVLIVSLLLVATVSYAQQPIPEKEFDFKLNAADIGLIGEALGQIPYAKVAPLMGKLQMQINQQNRPAASAPVTVQPPDNK